MADESEPANQSNESPLSLNRLREAFAAMLGSGEVRRTASGTPNTAGGARGESQSAPRSQRTAAPKPCEINTRTVTEAILFVGRPDNRALSARELAAAMRGVSPGEIDDAVRELNAQYAADNAPYCITTASSGYRLVLREEFGRMRDKLYGRVREAKLSAVAIEVLSVVAYTQPVTAAEIHELRGASNSAALTTLVRRRLIRQDRDPESGERRYWTTERFLKLFGLDGIDALPRSEELEKV